MDRREALWVEYRVGAAYRRGRAKGLFFVLCGLASQFALLAVSMFVLPDTAPLALVAGLNVLTLMIAMVVLDRRGERAELREREAAINCREGDDAG